MNNAYDHMLSIASQLNSINNNGIIRECVKLPTYVMESINRMIGRLSDTIVIDPEKDINIDKSIVVKSHDNFFPIYISTINNINKPIVDRVATNIDFKGNVGPGIVTVVGVPNIIFSSSDINVVSNILKDIYFGILDFDIYMGYKSSIKIVNLYDSDKINISTYDIEMIIIALCCMYINIGSWFDVNGEPVSPDKMLDIFGDDIDDNVRKKLVKVMTKYTNNNDLNNAVKNGNILKNFFIED